ncbi:MAG: arginine--tRNA ligase [Promethearchaeota archaeon]
MIIVDKKTIADFLGDYISYISVEEIERLIEIPPPEIGYTYAFPCFQLAKFEKKDPKIIAEQLKKKSSLTDYLESIEAIGPYLNFKIKPSIILQNIYELGGDYGKIYEVAKKEKSKPSKIVIEYPSPNTNKPLHFGHIRNILLGRSLSNLLRYKGDKVFEVNLYNNRGFHICKSMIAYKKWGKNKLPNVKSDHFVGDYYIKYVQMEKKDKKLIDDVYDLLKLWESGDNETRALWKKMNKWALDGFNETFNKFNINFDKEYFESDIYEKGKAIILSNLEKGIFEKTEDGAVFAKLKEKYKLPNKILLRRDGTSVYITQDIYLAFLKKQDFDYDKSIYVVANEQDLYFKQLFVVLEMIGFKEDKYHLSYGMVYLPEGKMKSREGIVVDADDIIEKMESLAYEEVNERYPELSEEEKIKRAKIIGMSALAFFILKFNPKSDFIFNPKESISFEGETGPYIQYCYARIESIISKSKEMINSDINWTLLSHNLEQNLIKQLNYFPEIVDTATKNYSIHLIAQYLLYLCQIFNSFYSVCPVISDNKELEKVRLLLIKCVQIVIKIGLDIMGIEVLDKM